MEAPGIGGTMGRSSYPAAPGNTSRRDWRATGLLPNPHTVAEVRRDVRQLLPGWGAEHVTWEAELLLAEVAGNTVRHARTLFDVILTVDRGTLRCEVTDADPRVPQLDHRPLDAEGGRGLRLVDELADRWGVTAYNKGKTVWFDLTVSGG